MAARHTHKTPLYNAHPSLTPCHATHTPRECTHCKSETRTTTMHPRNTSQSDPRIADACKTHTFGVEGILFVLNVIAVLFLVKVLKNLHGAPRQEQTPSEIKERMICAVAPHSSTHPVSNRCSFDTRCPNLTQRQPVAPRPAPTCASRPHPSVARHPPDVTIGPIIPRHRPSRCDSYQHTYIHTRHAHGNHATQKGQGNERGVVSASNRFAWFRDTQPTRTLGLLRW